MPKYHPLWILLAFLIVLAACTSTVSQSAGQVNTKLSTTISATVSTTISPIPTVGPVPRLCPISNPARHIISSQISAVVGRTPVWATWIPGPSVYREGSITGSSPPTNHDSAHGWEITEIVWEVGPNFTQAIMIRGYDVFDHNTPALIQLGGDDPTAHAVLNPRHPGHPVSVIGDGWAEWGSYIVVSKAGSYSLEVSWATGHWDVTFAFGA